MKKNISFKIILTLTAAYLTVGCNRLTDINRSPNDPPIESATPQVLFPSGVQSSAGRIGGELAIIGGIWSQFWTQAALSNQYKDIDSYGMQRQDRNGNYSGLYAGALNDYKLTIEKAKTTGPLQYYLFATVMKAYTYQVLVDLYDKVPYTEALQGQANLQPHFDDGYTIYKSLIAEIDAALDATESSDDLPEGATDFVFEGNINSWRAFANTLKLKMYLRMVNAKPAEAEAGIKALYASGAEFLSTEGAGVTSYINTPDQGNPFYEYNVRRLGVGNLRASRTFVTWLQAHSDPRIVPYFGSTNPNSINQGDYAATTTAEPTYSTAATPIQDATDPVWFISLPESLFMQAEARLRYYGGDQTATLFDQGVTASFEEHGLTSADIPVDPAFAYPAGGSFNAKLKTIIIQKWASLPGSHSLEAFFEQERTGYPEISPVDSKDESYAEDHAGEWVYSFGGVTSGKFPKRFVFPDVEASRNPNTPAQVPITTPVWWGKTN